jgi:hypothetical protein
MTNLRIIRDMASFEPIIFWIQAKRFTVWASFFDNSYQQLEKEDKQFTYNVILWGVFCSIVTQVKAWTPSIYTVQVRGYVTVSNTNYLFHYRFRLQCCYIIVGFKIVVMETQKRFPLLLLTNMCRCRCHNYTYWKRRQENAIMCTLQDCWQQA